MDQFKRGLITPVSFLGSEVENSSFPSSVVSCDLSLSAEEKHALASFDITYGTGDYSFFGVVTDPALGADIGGFLREVSRSSEEVINHVGSMIINLIQASSKILETDSAWVSLRASSAPDSSFNIPRWHKDGKYFTPAPANGHYKFATTLLGPKTRFGEVYWDSVDLFDLMLEAESQVRQSYAKSAELMRRAIDALVQPITASKLSDATFFLVGCDQAAIHSEPIINGPRLFLSVLPGTKEQIKSLKERWDNV